VSKSPHSCSSVARSVDDERQDSPTEPPPMQTIIAQIAERFIQTIVLTVAVLLGLIAVLQRRRTAVTVQGMLVTVGAVLTAPLHLIRDALDDIAQRVTSGVPGGRGDQHMLIRRGLSTAQLVIVISGLAIVAAGLVRG